MDNFDTKTASIFCPTKLIFLVGWFILTSRKLVRYNIDTTFPAAQSLINYDTKRIRTATAFPDSG